MPKKKAPTPPKAGAVSDSMARKEFELWVRGNWSWGRDHLQRNERGQYIDNEVSEYWYVWRQARKLIWNAAVSQLLSSCSKVASDRDVSLELRSDLVDKIDAYEHSVYDMEAN